MYYPFPRHRAAPPATGFCAAQWSWEAHWAATAQEAPLHRKRTAQDDHGRGSTVSMPQQSCGGVETAARECITEHGSPAATAATQTRHQSFRRHGGLLGDGATAAIVDDDDESDDGEGDFGQLVFNEDFLHSFVAPEPGAPTGALRAGVATLPEREDRASRAAQLEARRQRERQERLYGPRTFEVRALEAQLNEAFDRVSRLHEPVLWPAVPLAPQY